MSRHNNRKALERKHAEIPFKKPNSVVIVSHPENSRHSKKPMKKNALHERKRQTAECNIPMPAEPAHDKIMDICGWMRDDGFRTEELHQNIYKPASDKDYGRLREGLKTCENGANHRLTSYFEMIRDILKEM